MILMFHNIVPDSSSKTLGIPSHNLRKSEFLKIINFISKFCKIISLKEYLDNYIKKNKYPFLKCAITFDDGTASSLDNGIKFLVEKNIPITLFMSTCQINEKEILDGYFIAALCLESEYDSIKVENKNFPLTNLKQRLNAYEQIQTLINYKVKNNLIDNLRVTYPISAKSKKFYRGVTKKEIEAYLKNFDSLTLASHSNDHFSLKEMSKEKQYEEIKKSLEIISSINGGSTDYISFPYGEYNSDTIKIIKSLGFCAALTVNQSKLFDDCEFQVSRIGIYRSNLLYILAKFLRFQIRL